MDSFDHLWQQAEMARRELVAAGATTGLIAGFAASVQPVMAQTAIVTSAAGRDAGMVQVATAKGPFPPIAPSNPAPASGR